MIFEITKGNSMVFDDFEFALEELQAYTEDEIDSVSDSDWYNIPNIKESELPITIGGYVLRKSNMTKEEFLNLEKENVL